MEIIVSAVAVVAVCAIIVTIAVLRRFGKYDIIKKIEGYQGIALKMFESIEKAVPDTYGANTDDPAIAKAAHKLDLFVKKFTDFYKATTGEKPNEVLKSEIKAWAQEWANAHKVLEEEKKDA